MADPDAPSASGRGAKFKEIGMSGLVWSGTGTYSYVYEEFLVNLMGRRAIQVFKEMSTNDATIGGLLFAIESLIRQVKWDVEPNQDAEDPEGDAEFIESAMNDMSHTWTDHIGEVLTMLVYGWSWFEIVYKIRQGYQPESNKKATSKYKDGKIGWRKFAFRAQESIDHWVFDEEDGGVRAYVQRPAPLYHPLIIPIEKSLLFRTTTAKGNPEGKSLLRTAYRAWFYKKAMEDIEAIGVERDLAGLPVAYVDPDIMRSDAPPAEQALLTTINNIVKGIKRNKNEGVVWPVRYDESGNKMYDLQLLSSGGTRNFDTTTIINRYDQRMLMTCLADFLLLGAQQVGSFALSSDKTDLFAVALGSLLDTIQEVYNGYAVPRLYALNGMNTETMCKIKHGDLHSPDLESLGPYILALFQAGIPLMPNEDLLKYLMDAADLPAPTEEQIKVANMETSPPPMVTGAPTLPGMGGNNGPPTQNQSSNASASGSAADTAGAEADAGSGGKASYA